MTFALAQMADSVGNKGLCRMFAQGRLQAKPRMSFAGDAEERQADRVAAAIVADRTVTRAVADRSGAGERADRSGAGERADRTGADMVVARSPVGGPGGAVLENGGVVPEAAALTAIPSSEPAVARACCSSCEGPMPCEGAPGAVGGAGGVDAVLRSAGQSMDRETRSYFEPRFGRDFGNVSLHHGPDAAASARSLDARAYTVGSHIVFGSGEYAPATAAGRLLLAHELTHVVQQTGVPARLARWKITGKTATCDSAHETLGELASRASGYAADWPCIWPTKMQTAVVNSNSDEYYRFIQPGDTFDISNLVDMSGKTETISLGITGSPDPYLNVLAALYGANAPTNLLTQVQTLAGQGGTPLADFTLAGHVAGNTIYGNCQTCSAQTPRLDVSGISPDDDVILHNGAQAKTKKGPRRCWFTRTAKVRLVGCNSNTIAGTWAAVFLRKQAHALGTNEWLCGWVREVANPMFVPGHSPASVPRTVVRKFMTAQSRHTCEVEGRVIGTQHFSRGSLDSAPKLWDTKKGKL